MTPEERLHQLEQENRDLREQLARKEELIDQLTQRLAALEEQISKNSRNSSLPPSSDRFVRQPKSLRTKSGKKPGGQVKHPGSTLVMSEQPDEIRLHQVETCQHCQANLRAEPVLFRERRQVVDVPPERLLVCEHQVEQKWCPSCGQVTMAPFPDAVVAPVQYGTRIGAIAVYLVEQQLLPWARACEVLSDLLGVQMSEGTLCSLIERCAHNLLPVEDQLKAALRKATVLHQDETGLYLKGRRNWLHVSSTTHLTHYAVHAKRGREALDAIGILPHFHGTSVHDGWRSYFQYESCSHALCNVHHLRELVFIHETYQQEWAQEMKTLLLLMKERVQEAKQRGETRLDPLTLLALRGEYDRLLREGWQTNPPAARAGPSKPTRKRHPAVNLLDRLQVGKEAVLAFLSNFAVPFDNNQAERDVRMVKVQQKVSGSFRSEKGAGAFCRIRSYLSCLRKQGLHLLSALEATLCCHPVLPSFQWT
jgi:transposase